MPYRSPVTSSAHMAKVGIGIILFAPFLLAGLIIALPLALLVQFLPKRQMSAQQVAEAIRAFLNGEDEDWDWDDFTSNPIADPPLDAIVRRASLVPLPLDDEGERELRGLFAKAEALARAQP